LSPCHPDRVRKNYQGVCMTVRNRSRFALVWEGVTVPPESTVDVTVERRASYLMPKDIEIVRWKDLAEVR
jgi:hypothetical protein